MAKFRYSLQSILDIKMKMETQAKQEFATAKSVLDQEEGKLSELRRRKSVYELEASRLRQGHLSVRELEDNQNAILAMEGFIREQLVQVKKAQHLVEDAREHLANVMKDRKMHETLREKAFEEFLREENRQEGKAVDELTSYTYGQKRQVNG